jgi:hypothetical protein
MLVAFSNQYAKKVQAVVGSMRDGFGVQKAKWPAKPILILFSRKIRPSRRIAA